MKNYSKFNRVPVIITVLSAFLFLLSTFTITDNGVLHSFEWTPNDLSKQYSVFVNMGNGKFVIEDLAPGEVLETELPYPATNTYSPIVEATELYDDDKDPPDEMVYSGPTYTPNQPTSPGLEKVDLGTKSIKITPVRNMVQDHSLTYIITYENKCGEDIPKGDIVFFYDKPVLLYDKSVNYPNSQQVVTHNQSDAELNIQFTNLEVEEQRNIFLKFKTTASEGTEVLQVPKAVMTYVDMPDCEEEGMEDELTSHNIVVNGHDPNIKSIFPTSICKSDTVETIKFRVDFQNEGDGEVENVTVTDEIDILVPTNCMNHFEITNFSYPCTKMVSGRNLIFKFKGIGLAGTKQAGVDIDKTKGFVEFELPKSCLEFQNCGALCNQASIDFDCNPPIKTAIAKTLMPCDTVSCDFCADSVPITLDSIQRVLNNPVFTTPINVFGHASYTDFHWYPATGLSDPSILNPVFTDMLARDYILVASGKCKRQFVYVKTIGNCTLDFDVNITGSAGQNCTYDIEAIPTGNVSDTMNLIWQNCESAPRFKKQNISQKSIYISVKDPIAGCYKEKWVDLPLPLYLSDNSCNDQGDLDVSGGTTPYTYSWTWIDDADGLPKNSNAPYLKDISGFSNISVTVTDSNGCTEVREIKKENCGQSPLKSKWILWGLALVALLAMLYLFVREKSPE